MLTRVAVRTLIALTALAACTSCVRNLKIEDVALGYGEDRLESIVVSAPAEVVRTVSDIPAMYVRLAPCGVEAENKARYYPVSRGHVLTVQPTKLLLPIAPSDPQPEEALLSSMCAQLVADGMSLRRYRSNVVRARVAPA
jgi:hypothetical protein